MPTPVPLDNPAQFHLRPRKLACPRCELGTGPLCGDCQVVQFNNLGYAPRRVMPKVKFLDEADMVQLIPDGEVGEMP